MKTISLRIFGALLVLGVLSVIVPGVRADDPIDRANEIGQYQAQLFQETVQQYQDLRTFADEMNSMRQDTQPALPVAGPVAVPPKAPVAGPVAAAQVRFPLQVVPQQLPMPLDPVAFQQMVRQNQEKVRQQIMQTKQQILERHQEIIQQQQQIMRVQQ